MDRTRFLRELSSQRSYCAGKSPLYHEILQALECDALASPGWIRQIEAIWGERSFPLGWESVHLLLACMHAWALRSDAPELAAVYPSCAGFDRGAGRAAIRFMRRAPVAFWTELRSAVLQTNEVGRSIAWILPAATAFQARNLPFHLVELGAAAGLNLIGDYFKPTCRFISPLGSNSKPSPDFQMRPFDVLSRTGLDRMPRQVSQPRDRLWIRACVWADDRERMDRLDHAIEVFLKVAPRPRLERCEFLEMPEWLSNVRPRCEEGLLVFNAAASAFLNDDEYAALREKMTDVLAPWRDRAIWAECEVPRGKSFGPHELSIHRVVDGRLATRVLALMDARPREVRLLDD